MSIARRCALPAVLLVLSFAVQAAAQPARDWRQLVSSLQPGTRVDVDLTDGTHVEGTVIAQETDAFVINPKTRIPVMPWRIAHTEIRALDVKRSGGGMKPGITVLIGVGVGAGVLLILTAIALAAGS